MSGTKSAFIFPAFLSSNTADPFQGFEGAKEYFDALLEMVFTQTGVRFNTEDFFSESAIPSELFNQYITCCYSLTMAEMLHRRGFSPDYAAGYSMGIYAALVNAGCISFEMAIDLIRNAHESIISVVGVDPYGMCGIIGLSRRDINDIIEGKILEVEITNQNSDINFVLSGKKDDIKRICEAASLEGALHSREIHTAAPYHSPILKGTEFLFGSFVNTLDIQTPKHHLISTVNQQLLNSPEQLKAELIRNLYHPFNWHLTQIELLNQGVHYFVECGLGNNLAKNAKFIKGDFQFLSVAGYMKKRNG